MLLRISTAAAVLVCLVTAFLYTRASDEQIPQGATVVLTIWDSNSGLTLRESRDTIIAAARTHGVSFLKSNSPVVGTGDRTFTVVNRGQSSPAAGDYRDFSRALHTRIRPDQLPLNHLSGMYISTDSPTAVDQVAADLQQRGLQVSTLRTSPMRMLTWAAVTTPSLPLLLAGCILVVLGAAFWMLSMRRRDAIEHVNGRSVIRTALGHALHGIGLCAGLGVVGLICSLPVLAMYNGLAQWTRFAGNVAVGYAFTAALVAVAIILTSLLAPANRPAGAIAGRTPSRTALIGVVSLHTIALSLLVSIALSTFAVGGTAARNSSERVDWLRTSGWFALMLTSNLDQTEPTEAPLADLIRRQATDGHVLLSVHPYPPLDGSGPSNGNALIVNDRYLGEQCIRLTNGACATHNYLDPAALTLLVPSTVRDLRAVRDEWDGWARFQNSNTSEDPEALARSSVPIKVVRTKTGQRVFNFGAARGDDTSSQVDPVVAVVPHSLAFMSDNWLASSATTAEVFFDDHRSLRDALNDARLGMQVGQIDRASAIAANQLEIREQAVRDSTSAGALGAFVVIIAAVLLTGARAQRSRRVDFTRWSNGAGRRWGFITALLITNTFAVLLSVVSAPHVPWVVPTDPRALGVAGAVALADLGLAALTLGWHRRQVRLDTLSRS